MSRPPPPAAQPRRARRARGNAANLTQPTNMQPNKHLSSCAYYLVDLKSQESSNLKSNDSPDLYYPHKLKEALDPTDLRYCTEVDESHHKTGSPHPNQPDDTDCPPRDCSEASKGRQLRRYKVTISIEENKKFDRDNICDQNEQSSGVRGEIEKVMCFTLSQDIIKVEYCPRPRIPVDRREQYRLIDPDEDCDLGQEVEIVEIDCDT